MIGSVALATQLVRPQPRSAINLADRLVVSPTDQKTRDGGARSEGLRYASYPRIFRVFCSIATQALRYPRPEPKYSR
jgi:hypothetical protein